MTKFIVRTQDKEFYKCIEAAYIEQATAVMVSIVTELRAHGSDLPSYTIEPAPEADMFAAGDWLEDWNSPMSRHHY